MNLSIPLINLTEHTCKSIYKSIKKNANKMNSAAMNSEVKQINFYNQVKFILGMQESQLLVNISKVIKKII